MKMAVQSNHYIQSWERKLKGQKKPKVIKATVSRDFAFKQLKQKLLLPIKRHYSSFLAVTKFRVTRT